LLQLLAQVTIEAAEDTENADSVAVLSIASLNVITMFAFVAILVWVGEGALDDIHGAVVSAA
jgi:hypothetical protein